MATAIIAATKAKAAIFILARTSRFSGKGGGVELPTAKWTGLDLGGKKQLLVEATEALEKNGICV